MDWKISIIFPRITRMAADVRSFIREIRDGL